MKNQERAIAKRAAEGFGMPMEKNDIEDISTSIEEDEEEGGWEQGEGATKKVTK